MIYDFQNFGLHTFLPEECYPLNGEATLIDIETNKIELLGEFIINSCSDTIHIKSSMQSYFANKNELIQNGSNIRVQSIDINSTNFPSNYKYILTSNIDIKINDLKCSGVEFKGIAKVNPTFRFELNENSNVSIDMQPLYNDGKYCDMRVW